jgi:hypothetical protein
VPPHDDQPLEDLLAQSRARAEQFNVWLDQLRAGDPVFAEASPVYPDDMNEWQAATFCSPDAMRFGAPCGATCSAA